jgi:hypothetical protein
VLAALVLLSAVAQADAPVTMYIFPAGGQRGTSVAFRVGGLYLHESCPFEMQGPGVEASPRIEQTKTIWFEGPVIPLPDSQQAEDYPRDSAGSVRIATDAPLGARAWRVWTDQGAVASRPFIVGDLPEVVEDEIDGAPIPVEVPLPITVNGRIFPREDVDIWSFAARAGETITCTVLTNRLGSPFDAQLEVRDSRGARLAENGPIPPPGTDAAVRFTAPADGNYAVHICDAKFGGLQHYVYRLTIRAGAFVEHIYPLGGRRGTSGRFELTGANLPGAAVEIALPHDARSPFTTRLELPAGFSNPFALEVDDLSEVLEQEPNDEPGQVQTSPVPAVLNGRIDRPGDIDCWKFHATKGALLELDLCAARLGSPLDSVLSLADPAGKELARSDDIGGSQTDSFLQFTFPEEGTYLIQVADRFASRGGEAFAYRLRIAPPASPDFRLHVATDALSIDRGGEAKLKLRAERLGGFIDPIQIEFENLPPGVSVANPQITASSGEIELTFKAEAASAAGAQPVRIRGSAMVAGQSVVREAVFTSPAAPDLKLDTLLVAVSVSTPFKIKGVYEVKYAQRGRKFVRHYTIERGGYAGRLRVRLADRQARHLQGVTGPTIEVAAGVSEFDYPIFLPPWMEIGRTSRSVIMAVGEVEDADGRRHQVSFTSVQQNEQIVALVDPGQLSVDLERHSIAAEPGGAVTLSVQVGRGQGVDAPVSVELVIPAHIQGVSAEPLVLPANTVRGTLTIEFASGTCGPFNMPLRVRATARKGEDDLVVAETLLEVVAK